MADKLVDLLKGIIDEILGLPKSGQRVPMKLNGMFGVFVGILIVILFLPSELRELAVVIQAIRGKDIGETPPWALVVCLVSLLLYFLACVWITRGRGSDATHTPKSS